MPDDPGSFCSKQMNRGGYHDVIHNQTRYDHHGQS